MKNEDGYTLIDLLIILAAIGICAAIAIPPLMNSRARVATTPRPSGRLLRWPRRRAS